MNIYVSGRYCKDAPWELLGIFENESDAVSRCTNVFDFVAPAKLNESLSGVKEEWPGTYYPNLEEKPC